MLPLLLLFFWFDPWGWRQALTIKTIALQRDLHRDLAQAVRLTAQGDNWAGWILIATSFVYGVFHAVGPGHGKVVISTYLATQDRSIKSALLLTNLAALMQGAVALAVVAVALWVLQQTARAAQEWTGQLEIFSFACITGIGVYLAYRGARKWFTRNSGHHQGCGHHHHHHGPADQAGFWSTLVATGIRPCSGGILVLILAVSLGLWWHGALAVLAMSIGTGITVSILAVLVVTARGRAMELAATLTRTETHLAALSSLLAFVGGVLLIAFGISLIDGALATAEHPLMRR